MSLRDVLSEEQLLNILDIKKETLDELRRKDGFPFVPVTYQKRIYLKSSVFEWLKTRENPKVDANQALPD